MMNKSPKKSSIFLIALEYDIQVGLNFAKARSHAQNT